MGDVTLFCSGFQPISRRIAAAPIYRDDGKLWLEKITMPDLSKTDWNVSERARKIHAEALVWTVMPVSSRPKGDLEILEYWRAAVSTFSRSMSAMTWCPGRRRSRILALSSPAGEEHRSLHPGADARRYRRGEARGQARHRFDIEGMNSLDGEAICFVLLPARRAPDAVRL